jgi:hypothetical protein
MNDETQNPPNKTDAPNLPAGEPSRKLAFASLILGIIAVFFMAAGLLPGLPAIICGHKAVSRTKRFPDKYGGRGMAIVGLILGYIMSAISLTFIIYLILGMLDIVTL